MQLTKTLSIFFLSLLFFSSFTTVTPVVPAALPQQFPTKCDVWIGNHLDVDMSEVHFISPLEDVAFYNIAPDGGGASALEYETTGDVTITIDFTAPLPQDAIATIRYGLTTETVPIFAGTTTFRYRLYAIGPVGGIVVNVNYK
ncbi:MAG TPA: hypothetical protein VF008_13600 [Niastella sp.]